MWLEGRRQLVNASMASVILLADSRRQPAFKVSKLVLRVLQMAHIFFALFQVQARLKHNQGHSVAGTMLPEYSKVLDYANEHGFCTRS